MGRYETSVCGGEHYERGRNVQQTQPTGESRNRHVRVRRRDARWSRRGSVIDADLNPTRPFAECTQPTHPGRPEHHAAVSYVCSRHHTEFSRVRVRAAATAIAAAAKSKGRAQQRPSPKSPSSAVISFAFSMVRNFRAERLSEAKRRRRRHHGAVPRRPSQPISGRRRRDRVALGDAA